MKHRHGETGRTLGLDTAIRKWNLELLIEVVRAPNCFVRPTAAVELDNTNITQLLNMCDWNQ